MADDPGVTLAKAITQALTQEDFGRSLSVVRAYAPQYDSEKDTELRVTVCYMDRERSKLNRGADWYEPTIDVTVQKKMEDAADEQEQDGLLALSNAIQTFLRRNFVGFAFSDFNPAPFFIQDHIIQAGVFTSWVSVKYRGKIDVPSTGELQA